MMRHEDEEAKYDEGDDNREEDNADGSTMLLTVMRKTATSIAVSMMGPILPLESGLGELLVRLCLRTLNPKPQEPQEP